MQFSGSFCTYSNMLYAQLAFEELQQNPEKSKSTGKKQLLFNNTSLRCFNPSPGKKFTNRCSYFFFLMNDLSQLQT